VTRRRPGAILCTKELAGSAHRISRHSRRFDDLIASLRVVEALADGNAKAALPAGTELRLLIEREERGRLALAQDLRRSRRFSLLGEAQPLDLDKMTMNGHSRLERKALNESKKEKRKVDIRAGNKRSPSTYKSKILFDVSAF
jgi:hypothetical protein